MISIRSVKPGSVAKLLLEPRKLGSDDGLGVVRDIRQFRHGDPEQAVEARWLKMNGKGVDTSADQQLSASVRLRTHDGDTRRGVTAIRPKGPNAVSISEGERQELFWSRRQRNNERDGADLPCSHPVRPDVRPQHRTRWRHFRLKHMYNPRRRAVYQVSASRAETIAQGGKRVTSCATPRKVEIANALISLRTSLTLPRCSRVTSYAEVGSWCQSRTEGLVLCNGVAFRNPS
jgi:hypothetical protein